MDKQKETKITKEKPLKIPLPFKEALAALLATKPSKEKPKEHEKLEQKNPVIRLGFLIDSRSNFA